MALTLDATLAAAMESTSRRPLMEIISKQNTNDIPFDGSYLTSEIFDEYAPSVIAHSSGRLCLAYCYGPDSDNDSGIKYVYTDVDRQEFITVNIELFTDAAYVLQGVSITEMTGGNVCLTYLYTYSSNYYLASRILTVAGVLVAGSVKAIGNWATTTVTSIPHITTLTTNSYLMVYGKQSGSDYYIYKRTSADCLTWSDESALTIGGLTSTWRLDNPSIVKISTGDLWLWFDALEATSIAGDPLKNIYFSVSSDSGSTWSNATAFTAYATYDIIANHPVAVQKAAGYLTLLYNRIMGALHMDDSMTGWPTGDHTTELSWDSVNRKLYVINTGENYTGFYAHYRTLQCIVKVDLDSWTVDKYWDTTTTPAIPANFAGYNTHSWCSDITDGARIAFSSGQEEGNSAYMAPQVLYFDGEADTITIYDFTPTTGNVINTPVTNAAYGGVFATQVDYANGRIYCGINGRWTTSTPIIIGYIDLSNSTWTTILSYTGGAGTTDMNSFIVDTASDSLVVIERRDHNEYVNHLSLYNLTSGALIKAWSDAHAEQPYIYDGKLYCGHWSYVDASTCTSCLRVYDLTALTYTDYEPSYKDGSYAKAGDGIIWAYPYTYVGYRNFDAFSRPQLISDNKLAMVHCPYGIVLFDTVTHEWTRYSNINIPGFTADGIEPSYQTNLVFDATNELIMFGDSNGKGLIAFNADGYIKQTLYATGSFDGSVWSWAASAQMMQGFTDYDAAPVVEPGSVSSMFVFWTNRANDGELSLQWDKDGAQTDISGYITGEVNESKSIDGAPATLSFAVSHGHLFDPYNTASMLSNMLKKGVKLTLRWGENISGTPYWQASGTYYVVETSLSFQRGTYPIMNVRAEDYRCFWDFKHIYATDSYNNTPKEILDDLLEDIGGLSAGELNIPAMSTATLQHQWIETNLIDVIDQVCERFGYYFRFDVNGYAHARLISDAAAVDHTYTDCVQIIVWTPDDTYSNFTNRVTVRGQELTFTEVTYAEEQIDTISGSMGWWGCKADHQVWFSKDRSRRVIEPRMVILESSCSIAMELAGSVTESLTANTTGNDADKYCLVVISAPNLVPVLIGLIAALLAAVWIMDYVVTVGWIASGGYTVVFGTAIRTLLIISINMVLGSIANYQIEIWGKPLGQIRRSIQGTANDTTHQIEIGYISEEVIEDPFCYTREDCEAVAEFELMVARLQRRRVKLTKIAHLQDEDGDTIRLKHPISNQDLDLYLCSLQRRFKKSTADEEGYFLDDLEGWVL